MQGLLMADCPQLTWNGREMSWLATLCRSVKTFWMLPCHRWIHPVSLAFLGACFVSNVSTLKCLEVKSSSLRDLLLNFQGSEQGDVPMQNVTESDDFNAAWMENFIEASATFDRRMNQAVIDSGILRHIPRPALTKEGMPPRHTITADWSCKY